MQDNGIRLEETKVVFGEDQQKFKLLTNFLNCYKDKMMLSLKDEEQNDVIAKEQGQA